MRDYPPRTRERGGNAGPSNGARKSETPMSALQNRCALMNASSPRRGARTGVEFKTSRVPRGRPIQRSLRRLTIDAERFRT